MDDQIFCTGRMNGVIVLSHYGLMGMILLNNYFIKLGESGASIHSDYVFFKGLIGYIA